MTWKGIASGIRPLEACDSQWINIKKKVIIHSNLSFKFESNLKNEINLYQWGLI